MRSLQAEIGLLFLLAVLLGSCATTEDTDHDAVAGSAAAEPCEPDLPDDRIISTRQESTNSGTAARIWMRNHSRCAIRITTILLYECENIRNACGTAIPRNVELGPLRERIVLHVSPRDRNRGWNFRWRYQWEQR